MTDEIFLQAFTACTLTHAEWNHRAHVKLGYLYLCRHPLEEAVARVRAGIQALNAAHGTPEGPDRGYHETVTQAWLRIIHCTLSEYGPAETADRFFEQQPQLSQKQTLRLFYSRERLMSAQAKREFVEPDLAPLPQSKRSGFAQAKEPLRVSGVCGDGTGGAGGSPGALVHLR
jgi:hypothetical protein